MTYFMNAILLALALVAASLAGALAQAADKKLPRGFVYLDSLAPDIISEMRYATPSNFTGRRVPGYRANRCILARPVARALARVQKSAKSAGYTLKVYDCYRPTRSVRAFFRWAQGRFGSPNKAYYPRIARNRVIPLGYIARRSSHSRGTAVDLTLVKLNKTNATPRASSRDSTSCTNPKPEASPASIDMGTSWDCFDELSHTRHGSITKTARANRQRLMRAMHAQGFRNYKREWWHYSMSLQRFKRGHNFPIE